MKVSLGTDVPLSCWTLMAYSKSFFNFLVYALVLMFEKGTLFMLFLYAFKYCRSPPIFNKRWMSALSPSSLATFESLVSASRNLVLYERSFT